MASDRPPVLIAGAPRSGTTFLAMILHHHGYWVGRARTTMYPGTNSQFGSENLDIKGVLKKEAKRIGYRNWRVPLPDCKDYDPRLGEKIERFVPDGTEWLVKTAWTLIFHRFWNDAYPDAKWVFTYRRPRSILSSMRDHPGMKRHPSEINKNFVYALTARQHEINKMVKHSMFLNMLKFSRKDREVTQSLFNFIGTTVDWEIIERCVIPKMFKRRA